MLQVSESVLAELRAVSSSRVKQARIVERAQTVLAILEGFTQLEVAGKLRRSLSFVKNWWRRFRDCPHMDSLKDRPRTGAPRKIPAMTRILVAQIACSPPDELICSAGYWRLADIARAIHKETTEIVSLSTVRRVLNNNQIRPHKYKMWLHSPDPDFIEKAQNICDLYRHCSDPVICVDEKTGMQALERRYDTQVGPGGIQRIEYEYKRHGTQFLIAGFDIHTGQVHGHCGDTRKADDLIDFMDDLATRYPEGPVNIVWDNLNIHHGPRWEEFNARHGMRFKFHYIPIHASWLNQVEIFFGILHRQQLNPRKSFTSKIELNRRMMHFISVWNSRDAHPFKWNYEVPGRESTNPEHIKKAA